jgi:predicted trehalose synthase
MPLTDVLETWMPLQRWFAGKGHAPRLRLLETVSGADPAVTTYLVMDEAGAIPVLYQVPLVACEEVGPELESAIVGQMDDIYLVDGPHHPAYTRALLASMDVPTDAVTGSSVMKGEQSNTSIVYSQNGTPAIIAKVFRTLHHGENPDVTLQSALSDAGSPFVPHFIGQVAREWPDAGRSEGVARGTLAFAQEFLAGVKDGWALALGAATRDDSFVEEARALGVATAAVHSTLAAVKPTRDVGDDDVTAMAGVWSRRLRTASAEVAEIAERGDEIAAVYDAARTTEWPPLQRVHGDLHLGQVLMVPDRGWVLVDFEGEPLRPMNERSNPDVAVRDVAGMLRSFEYAAGSVDGDRSAWVAAAREAFLDGYGATSGIDFGTGNALLEAFELDKAVYEAIYEARNRPTWLGIPLKGIDELLARSRRSR